MNDIELGWVAGIIEGEGTICSRPSTSGSNYVEVLMTDEDTIQKLLTITGLGHVRGPYQRENRKLFWIWHVADAPSLAYLFDRIYPLMSERRQEKIRECSQTIARKLEKLMPRPCNQCEKIYNPKNNNLYCSRQCLDKFHNLKRKKVLING